MCDKNMWFPFVVFANSDVGPGGYSLYSDDRDDCRILGGM